MSFRKLKRMAAGLGALSLAAAMPVAAYAEDRTVSVKYAVCIYGINHDVDANGNPIGLTFGPATGKDYTQTEEHCDNTSDQSHGNCIHWMTWDEIIEHANTDPEIFRGCLEHGCTKAVELDFTGKEFATSDYSNGTVWNKDGDGAGMFAKSMTADARQWNDTASNEGGWPESKIRGTLNDPDGLISTFPEALQEAIVPKAVRSDTVYGDTDGNNVTTNDKLWLFSGKEIFNPGGTGDAIIRKNEGELYERCEKLGFKTDSFDGNGAYGENNTSYNRWLRTISWKDPANVVHLYPTGSPTLGDPSANSGTCISPGFCLGGTDIGASVSGVIGGDDVTVDFTNTMVAFSLPTTGGMGRKPIILGGTAAMLAGLAAIAACRRKKDGAGKE